jgi:hypothetical protein
MKFCRICHKCSLITFTPIKITFSSMEVIGADMYANLDVGEQMTCSFMMINGKRSLDRTYNQLWEYFTLLGKSITPFMLQGMIMMEFKVLGME